MTPGGAARVLAQCARWALAQQPCFTAALCGTTRADRLVEALVRHRAWQKLDNRRVHLFVLDDAWPWRRDVPAPLLPVPVTNLHRPRTTLSRADAALHYELLLRAHFSLRAGELPVFDLVVLDGREAASGDLAAQVTRLVVPACSRSGVTLSAPVIRAAARVVALGPTTRPCSPHRGRAAAVRAAANRHT